MREGAQGKKTDERWGLAETLGVLASGLVTLFAVTWLRCQIWWLIAHHYGLRGLTMLEMFGISLLLVTFVWRGPVTKDSTPAEAIARQASRVFQMVGLWGLAILVSWELTP